MKQLKFLSPLLICIVIFSQCSRTQEEISYPLSPEKCLLQKFEDLGATISSTQYNNTWFDKMYKISQSEIIADSSFLFNHFEFRVLTYPTIIEAQEGLNEIRSDVTTHGYKSPEYLLRYSNCIYHLRTGCFNAANIDSIFDIFLSCLEIEKLDSEDIIRIQCGGAIIPHVLN